MAIVELQFVKDYLGITDTSYDIKIVSLIPLVEQSYLDLRNVPWDVDSSGDIVYPVGSDVTASEMIGFKLATSTFNKDFGKIKQSESIDAYSASFGDVLSGGAGGYPKSIISSIKRYVDGR